MTANTTNSVENIGAGGSNGTTLGSSATEKISFYGTTAVTQQTVTAVATGATAATIVTSLQALQAALNTLGLIKNA